MPVAVVHARIVRGARLLGGRTQTDDYRQRERDKSLHLA
jgi:hypothetical protein